MNDEKNQPAAIREERFVETDAKAFTILSKEESDKLREQAKIAEEQKNQTIHSA